MDSPRSATSKPGASGVEQAVVDVGLMDDLRQPPERRVAEVVTAQQRLEGAVRPVVGQSRPAHVEWDRVRRQRHPDDRLGGFVRWTEFRS